MNPYIGILLLDIINQKLLEGKKEKTTKGTIVESNVDR